LTLLTLLVPLGSLLFVGALVVVALMVALLVWAARIEWRGTWRGHVIVIRNTTLSETLFIDGQQATSGEGRLKLSETLTGVLHDGPDRVPVLAIIEPANLGLSIGARLFVGGEEVPLERGGIGAFTSGRTSAPIELGERVPTDPRWRAMLALVTAIRRSGGEAVADVCDQATAHVRALLLDIEDLREAEEAHSLLDGETGQGRQEAAAIREQREAAVKELFRAIQALHLQTTAGPGPMDVSDLLARLQGEAEVAGKPEDARRRRMQQAAKTRQTS
jgi:hypothetical protein